MASQEKSFGQFPFPAQLERSEILEPPPFGHFGLGLDSDSQPVQVLDPDFAVMHALDEMSADGGGHARPGLDMRHLLPKDEASHVVTQSLDVFRVLGGAKALGQIEEGPFLLLLSLDSLFNQFDQNPVLAETAAAGNAIHLLGDLRGQRNTTADRLACGHDLSIHHSGAEWWASLRIQSRLLQVSRFSRSGGFPLSL